MAKHLWVGALTLAAVSAASAQQIQYTVNNAVFTQNVNTSPPYSDLTINLGVT